MNKNPLVISFFVSLNPEQVEMFNSDYETHDSEKPYFVFS